MKTVKLGDVCELITRGISPKYTEDVNLGVTVLNQRCIRNKSVLYEFSRLHNISAKTVNESKFVKSKDVLVNSTGHGTLGRTALVDNVNKPLLVDSHVTILRPVEGLFEPRYFAYLIGQCESDFIEMATGTSGQTELPRVLLNEYEVSYEQSLEEQRKIVARLDAAFERISAAEVLMRRNLDNVAALQKSILHKYLSASDSTHTHRLGDIIRIRSGDFLPRKKMVTAGQYTVVGGNGESGRHDQFNRSGENIIIGRVGEKCGNVHYFNQDVWVTDNAFYVSDYLTDVNKQFMAYAISHLNLRQFARQSAQPVISFTGIKNTNVYVPDIDMQNEIVTKLDKSLDETHKLESQYQKKLAKLTDLRQSLLARAFMTTNKV